MSELSGGRGVSSRRGGGGGARPGPRNKRQRHEVRGWLGEPRAERDQLLRWIAGLPAVLATVIVFWDWPRFIPGWIIPVLMIGLTAASWPPRRVMPWRWRLLRPWWTSWQTIARWYMATAAATLPAIAAESHASPGTGLVVSAAALPLAIMTAAWRPRGPRAPREPVTQVIAPVMPWVPLPPGSPRQPVPFGAGWPGSSEPTPAPGPARHMTGPDFNGGWRPPA
jgi:hypothetical protein